jgi:hypothetical protein
VAKLSDAPSSHDALWAALYALVSGRGAGAWDTLSEVDQREAALAAVAAAAASGYPRCAALLASAAQRRSREPLLALAWLLARSGATPAPAPPRQQLSRPWRPRP